MLYNLLTYIKGKHINFTSVWIFGRMPGNVVKYEIMAGNDLEKEIRIVPNLMRRLIVG